MPAVGVCAGGVITSVGAFAMLTVTLPDAWPEADGVVPVVGVVPPVAGGVVVLVPTPTLAVTVAETDVVNTLLAVPVASVIATPVLSEPAVDEKVTGTSVRTAPFKSKTIALMVLVPPAAGTVAGFAATEIFCAAALPTRIFREFVPVVAPPEIAVTDAVPDAGAVKIVVARPLVSVVASAG